MSSQVLARETETHHSMGQRDWRGIDQSRRAILWAGELPLEATCKKRLHVRDEGFHRIRRKINVYNCDAVLALPYRPRFPRVARRYRWAPTVLWQPLSSDCDLVSDTARDFFAGIQTYAPRCHWTHRSERPWSIP